MKKASAKPSNELTDFYKVCPKRFKTEYYNPSYKNHGLNIPWRMVIVGASGSGKTTLALEIIKRASNTFGKITIVCKDKDEPLYKLLRHKIPNDDQLDIVEGVENIPAMESLDAHKAHLVIFDDMVGTKEKDQQLILEYYKRARKVAQGVSLCYLTQSFFKTPKFIRINANYLLIKKLSSTGDLNLILRDCAVGVDKKTLLALYKYATDDKRSFLLVDLDAPEEARFRRNFLEILPSS